MGSKSTFSAGSILALCPLGGSIECDPYPTGSVHALCLRRRVISGFLAGFEPYFQAFGHRLVAALWWPAHAFFRVFCHTRIVRTKVEPIKPGYSTPLTFVRTLVL